MRGKLNSSVNVIRLINVIKTLFEILVILIVKIEKRVAHLLVDQCKENINEDDMIQN